MNDYRVMSTGRSIRGITAVNEFEAATIYAEDVIGYYDIIGSTLNEKTKMMIYYVFVQAPIRQGVRLEDAMTEWVLEFITVSPIIRGQVGK